MSKPAALAVALVVIAVAVGSGYLTRRRAAPVRAVGEVVRVVDGDTYNIEGYGNVRQLLADTPELKNNDHGPRGCFAKTAKAFVEERLPPGTPVRLVFDVQTMDTRWNRPLAYVERVSDGLDIGEELIRHGLAEIYDPDWNRNRARLGQYEKAMAVAARAELGIWGPTCAP
jgi:micrococcal nuclease